MGWTNSHLYEIRARDVGWSTALPDVDGAGDFFDARKAKLDKSSKTSALRNAASRPESTLVFISTVKITI
jgi:hypothetical protein